MGIYGLSLENLGQLVLIMAKLKQDEVFRVCANIFSKFPDKSEKSKIVNAFRIAGIPTTTAYRQYKKLISGAENSRKNGSGLKSSRFNTRTIRRIENMVENRVFCGYRSVGRKIGVDHKTAKKYMQQAGINVRMRKKIPKVSADQAKRQKTRVRRLRKLMGESEIIMDDESYFDLEGFNFYGADRFAFTNLENVDDSIKFRQKSKFSPKLMMWIAVGTKGHCEPYFHRTKGAVNAEIYSDQCLIRRLIPWLKNRYKSQRILFWPDLASCHYARNTLETLDGASVDYVKKEDNPPNCPQLRPIEDFWANLKCKVYSDGWLPSSKENLIERINTKLRTFSRSYYMKLMSKVKSKVNQADRCGVNSLIH